MDKDMALKATHPLIGTSVAQGFGSLTPRHTVITKAISVPASPRMPGSFTTTTCPDRGRQNMVVYHHVPNSSQMFPGLKNSCWMETLKHVLLRKATSACQGMPYELQDLAVQLLPAPSTLLDVTSLLCTRPGFAPAKVASAHAHCTWGSWTKGTESYKKEGSQGIHGHLYIEHLYICGDLMYLKVEGRYMWRCTSYRFI